MVVKIDKEEKIYVDGIEKQMKDVDSSFLDLLFKKMLKKDASIEIEDENSGYIAQLFSDIKKATDENSDFFKEYNSLRDEYSELKKVEDTLNEESETKV